MRDGVIDAVATDHAPHRMEQKRGDLAAAAPGMIGLETALAVCITLGGMHGDWIPVLLERMTTGPHRVLGPAVGGREPRLRVGEAATCVLFDPAAEWTVGESDGLLACRSNTPLRGTRLRGRVLLTISDGVIVHHEESLLRLAGAAGGGCRWLSTSPGRLALEVGRGVRRAGCSAPTVPASNGEVVFNTCMAGYQEVITDPSYAGQVVVMTHPLMGNYGCRDDTAESYRVHCRALVVRELSARRRPRARRAHPRRGAAPLGRARPARCRHPCAHPPPARPRHPARGHRRRRRR